MQKLGYPRGDLVTKPRLEVPIRPMAFAGEAG